MDRAKDQTKSPTIDNVQLTLGSNPPQAKGNPMNDLNSQVQSKEIKGINIDTNEHHSEHRMQHQGDILQQSYQDQAEEQQQDGEYFKYIKTKLLSLDDQPFNTKLPIDSNINEDKVTTKEGLQQQSNLEYNTGNIEIMQYSTPMKESTELLNGNIYHNTVADTQHDAAQENITINNPKHELLYMMPISNASQLQSYTSTPESRDVFNFTPAKVSIFQNDLTNQKQINQSNLKNQVDQLQQSKPSPSLTKSNQNSIWTLSQLKKGSLWSIKVCQIIFLIAIISSIIGLACFYAADAHGEKGVLVGLMYPLYGLLFQVILIPLHRAHYLSLHLLFKHQKTSTTHTTLSILATTSRNQEISHLLNIQIFLFIYKPIIIQSSIFVIITSIIYGIIIELGIISRLNDGYINQRELIVLQTFLRLTLMVLIVLINGLIIAIKRYRIQNQDNNKDNASIQSNNNYLGTVYKEFKADMANLQNNLHIGLTNAIQQQITQGNHHKDSQIDGKNQDNNQQEQHKEINNNQITIPCETHIPSIDTEQFHQPGQGILLGGANSAKKLVTNDQQAIQLNGYNKPNGISKDIEKTLNKSITMTGETQNKRQQILMQTPFKDKSVTWNDQNSPPKHIRNTLNTSAKYHEETEEDQQEDEEQTYQKPNLQQTKKSLSNHINLFTTPTKQNGIITVTTLQTEIPKNHNTSDITTTQNPLVKNLNQSGVSQSSTLTRSKLQDELYQQNKSINGNIISNQEITAFLSKINTSEIFQLTFSSFKLILTVFFTHFFGVSIIANYTLFDHEIGFYFLCLGFYGISVIIVIFQNHPLKNDEQKKKYPTNVTHTSQQQDNQLDCILDICNIPFRSCILIACVGCNAISYSLSEFTRSAWILMGIRLFLVLGVFIVPVEFAEYKLHKSQRIYLKNIAETAQTLQQTKQGKYEEDNYHQDKNNSRTNRNKILLKIQTKSYPSPAKSPTKIPNNCTNNISINNDSDQNSPIKIIGQCKEDCQQSILQQPSNAPKNNPLLPLGLHVPHQNILSFAPSLKAITTYQTQKTQDFLAYQDKIKMDNQIQSVQNTRSQSFQNLLIFCISQGAALIAFIVVTFTAKHDGLYHFRSLISGKNNYNMIDSSNQFDVDYSNVYLVFLIEILSLLLILMITFVSFNRKSIKTKIPSFPSFLEFLAINLKQAILPLILSFFFIQHLLYILFNN